MRARKRLDRWMYGEYDKRQARRNRRRVARARAAREAEIREELAALRR